MNAEFKAAIEGTEGQVLPEDEVARQTSGASKTSGSVAFSGDTLQVPGGAKSTSGGSQTGTRSVLKNL